MPEGAAYQEKERVFLGPGVGASSSIIVQLSTKGMEKRLGTAVKPSVALQAQHIQKNQDKRKKGLEELQIGVPSWYQLLLAQMAELLLWLGWL